MRVKFLVRPPPSSGESRIFFPGVRANLSFSFAKKCMKIKQECIPVECILSAAVAVSCGGVCLKCLPEVSAWGCLPGGCLLQWVSAQGGSAYQGVSTRHPLVNRITDRCKNITLPQLYTVKKWNPK